MQSARSWGGSVSHGSGSIRGGGGGGGGGLKVLSSYHIWPLA